MNSPQASASPPIEWGRWLLLGCMAIFFLALGYATVYRAAWNDIERTDFTVYSAAGQAVLDGTDIYSAHNARGWLYVYPPTFAVFLPVFAKLPLAWGSALWYLLLLAGMGYSLTMAVKLARVAAAPLAGENDRWTLVELPLLLASPWLVSGMLRCQASGFMVWLMIGAVYLWWRGRHLWGGACLAAAVLMKAFPLALLVYFGWRRQWRFLGGFALGMLLGGLLLPAAVFGWQKNLDYWQQWGKLVAGPALSSNDARQGNKLYEQLLDAKKPRNQSLESLLLSAELPPGQAKVWLALIAAAMLAAMCWMDRRVDGKSQWLVVSAFLVWNLLIPPISESHYFGLLLVPLALLTAVMLGEEDRFSRRLCAAVLLLFFVTTVWSSLDRNFQLYRPLCWASLAVWFCLLTVAYRRPPAAPSL